MPIECDNTYCDNRNHKKSTCKLKNITLYKTWAGSETNYRFICKSATDLPKPKEN